MLLYGASMIYGFAGTTRFDALAALFTGPSADPGVGVVVGLVFLLAGLAFKVSAVPFHMWTPDVYEGAPTPVTAFFAVAPKIAAIALLVRTMVGPFGELFAQWQQIIVFISIASMLLGGNFLDYDVLRDDPTKGQHLGILLIEFGVGLTVASVMLSLYLTFAGRVTHLRLLSKTEAHEKFLAEEEARK